MCKIIEVNILIFLIAYITATLWEHYQHKHILHADSDKVKKWKNSSFWLYQAFYKGGYYAHHIVHHQLTFQKKYTQQFDSIEQRHKLDELLMKKFGKTDDNQNYGLTINTFYEYALFVLPAFFLLPILAFVFNFIIWLFYPLRVFCLKAMAN